MRTKVLFIVLLIGWLLLSAIGCQEERVRGRSRRRGRQAVTRVAPRSARIARDAGARVSTSTVPSPPTPSIRPVEEGYTPWVLRAYRQLLKPGSRRDWLAATHRCLKRNGGHLTYGNVVQRAADLTGYHPSFVAGLAVHESYCNPTLLTRDGGYGLAQITPQRGVVDARWLRRARQILRHEPNWRHEPLDNLVLGLAELLEAQEEFGDVGLGLAAYNAGIGGVRNAQSQSGWEEGQPFLSLTRITPRLRYWRHHWDARHYAAKVLATSLLVDRVVRAGSLQLSPRLRMQNIPGSARSTP